MFGRGADEAMALALAGVPFRLIPGVTAGLGALAAAAIPATVRGINRAIILATGHGADGNAMPDSDWAALARTGQPIAIYMAMHNLAGIIDALRRGGLDPATAVAVIAAATTADERILISTLDRVVAEVRAQQLEPPAIIVVGGIVQFRARLLEAIAAARSSAR
jgi:uroporphyrin-III C-methyltransferase